ncbi:hypothetical protein BH23ACT11_BH23ACT11_30790 [soil metagenome]
MIPIWLILLVLGVFGLGYFVSSALRTRSALLTLVLLALSVSVFVLFNISFYLDIVFADETGKVGGTVGWNAGWTPVFLLMSLGLGIASLVVHLRARRSDH